MADTAKGLGQGRELAKVQSNLGDTGAKLQVCRGWRGRCTLCCSGWTMEEQHASMPPCLLLPAAACCPYLSPQLPALHSPLFSFFSAALADVTSRDMLRMERGEGEEGEGIERKLPGNTDSLYESCMDGQGSSHLQTSLIAVTCLFIDYREINKHKYMCIYSYTHTFIHSCQHLRTPFFSGHPANHCRRRMAALQMANN